MGDFNPDNYKDRFVADLVGFVAGEGFQSLFERFFLKYAPEFSYEAEHKLRYYDLYIEFQGLFEEQLESFQKQLNLTPAQFFQRCRESSEEDEKCKRYIDILLSSSEYETFVKLMKIMRPIAEARLAIMEEQADAKGELEDIENMERDSPSKASAKGGDDDDSAVNNSDAKYVELDDMSDAKAGAGAKDYEPLSK